MMVPLYSLFVLAETVNDDGNRSLYTYKIINKYPHNTEDFTEGLIYEKGIIYESTGQYGKSKMKKYKLGSIEPLKSYSLPMMYFGEGATILENKIYQLTWKSRVGFVYNKDLKLLGNFNYKTRGWGLTTDGKSLIMSDGTNRLFYINPKTFKEEKIVEVYDKDAPVVNINELEYINGKIYANIFMTDFISIINPESGRVDGWIDLSGILEKENISAPVDVLNGIAYDEASKRLFVTGKYWPYIYEIELMKRDN
jgi:glutamine cyclotransferase